MAATEHRFLLDNIDANSVETLAQQSETITRLQEHIAVLANLENQNAQMQSKLLDQEVVMQDVQSVVRTAQGNTASILSSATEILTMATSGLMSLQQLGQQLTRAVDMCTKFTTEMRATSEYLLKSHIRLKVQGGC